VVGGTVSLTHQFDNVFFLLLRQPERGGKHCNTRNPGVNISFLNDTGTPKLYRPWNVRNLPLVTRMNCVSVYHRNNCYQAFNMKFHKFFFEKGATPEGDYIYSTDKQLRRAEQWQP
ncbi:MAG: hypothetical protein ACYSR6_12050, partial [Planctomycetota bacterium]|jgi:hypothetical protein